MGLHLRKYSTGVPTQAYTYENIQQDCLHHGPTSTKIFNRTACIGLHLRKYSAGVPTSWAYIYQNIQQDCLHGPTSTKIFNRGAYIVLVKVFFLTQTNTNLKMQLYNHPHPCMSILMHPWFWRHSCKRPSLTPLRS